MLAYIGWRVLATTCFGISILVTLGIGRIYRVYNIQNDLVAELGGGITRDRLVEIDPSAASTPVGEVDRDRLVEIDLPTGKPVTDPRPTWPQPRWATTSPTWTTVEANWATRSEAAPADVSLPSQADTADEGDASHSHYVPGGEQQLSPAGAKSARVPDTQLNIGRLLYGPVLRYDPIRAGGKPAAETSTTTPVPRTGWLRGQAQRPGRLRFTLMLTILIACCMLIAAMPSPFHGSSTARVPPAWTPEHERQYPFATWVDDIYNWCLNNNDQPHQQCAAITMQLGGAARELARTMTPQERMHGGIVNGVQVDPVTMLFHGLQERFGPLGEETRMTAMVELMTFDRRHGERINEVASRFEVTRAVASRDAGFTMNTEAVAMTFLRAVGITDEQLLQILAPLSGRFPNTDAELRQMIAYIRRMGHILERSPGNVASALRPAGSRGSAREPRGEHARAYVGMGESAASSDPNTAWAASETWMSGSGTGWGYGLGGTGASAGSSYMSIPNQTEEDGSSEESTATSSDNGSENLNDPSIASLAPAQQGEHIYWAYTKAKKTWRRFSMKPTRHVRRFSKRKGKGGKGNRKGKSSGKFATMYMATEEVAVYFKGKGKGLRKGSTNKGFRGGGKGSRTNPKGPDGTTMLCSICNSDTHFRARCPTASTGSGQSQPSFPVVAATAAQSYTAVGAGPLDDILAAAQAPAQALALMVTEVPTEPMEVDTQNTSDDTSVAQPMEDSVSTDPWVLADPWSQPSAESGSSVAGTVATAGAQPGQSWGTHNDRWWRENEQHMHDWNWRNNRTPGPHYRNGTVFTHVPKNAAWQASTAERIRAIPAVPEVEVPVVVNRHWTPESGKPKPPTPSPSQLRGNPETPEELARHDASIARHDEAVASAIARHRTNLAVAGSGQNPIPVALQPATERDRELSALVAKALTRPHPGQRPADWPVPFKAPPPDNYPYMMLGLSQTTHTNPNNQHPPITPRLSRTGVSEVGPPLVTGGFGGPPPPKSTPAGPRGPDSVRPHWAVGGDTTARTRAHMQFATHMSSLGTGTNAQDRVVEGGSLSEVATNMASVQTMRADAVRQRNASGPGGTGAASSQPPPGRGQWPAWNTVPPRVQNHMTTTYPLPQHTAPPPAPIAAPPTPIRFYSGGDDSCSICLEPYVEQARVCRLTCMHTFHASCFQDMLLAVGTPLCPNCRGSPQIAAVWYYLATLPDLTQGRPNLVTPTDNEVYTAMIGGTVEAVVQPSLQAADVAANVSPRPVDTLRLDADDSDSGVPAGDEHDPDDPSSGEEVSSSGEGDEVPLTGVSAQLMTIETPRSVTTETESRSLAPSNSQHSDMTSYPIGMDPRAATGSMLMPGIGPPLVSAAQDRVVAGGASTAYLNTPALPDGSQALLVDPGSYGNIAGGNWVKRTATLAIQGGASAKPVQTKRKTPLNVSGVGTGSQVCNYDVTLPIALRNDRGETLSATFSSATLDDGDLPALLGLKTLVEQRALLDLSTMKLHFCGPGDATINLPPGSQSFQLSQSTSGHLMLPCCNFEGGRQLHDASSSSLALATATSPGPGVPETDGSAAPPGLGVGTPPVSN